MGDNTSGVVIVPGTRIGSGGEIPPSPPRNSSTDNNAVYIWYKCSSIMRHFLMRDRVIIYNDCGWLHQTTSLLNQTSIAQFSQVEIMLNMIAYQKWCAVIKEFNHRRFTDWSMMLVGAIGHLCLMRMRESERVYSVCQTFSCSKSSAVAYGLWHQSRRSRGKWSVRSVSRDTVSVVLTSPGAELDP